jgi:hypothetical protein
MPKSAAGWSAVSIIGASGSCAASRSLKGQRFLGSEAPRLPLADCSAPGSCRCVYRKHPDRRAGPRREGERSGVNRPGPKPERRGKRGRRSTD